MTPCMLRLVLYAYPLIAALSVQGGDATFYRAINLNGPALSIDGHAWEGGDAKDFSVNGGAFENQSITLRPATDTARAKMIRSSRMGDRVDVSVSNVPAGKCQVFLY